MNALVGNRTQDPSIKSAVLYHLSYERKCLQVQHFQDFVILLVIAISTFIPRRNQIRSQNPGFVCHPRKLAACYSKRPDATAKHLFGSARHAEGQFYGPSAAA